MVSSLDILTFIPSIALISAVTFYRSSNSNPLTSAAYEIAELTRTQTLDAVANTFMTVRTYKPYLEIHSDWINTYLKTFTPVVLSAILLSYVILETKRNEAVKMPSTKRRKVKVIDVRRPITRSMTRASLQSNA